MKEKWIKNAGRKKFPIRALFLCGFLVGNLIPNLMWKLEWRQKTLASMYLLAVFADKSVSDKEYFMNVLKLRGGYYLLISICGFSVFGVPLAVVGTLILGAEIGALLSMSVLEFGLSGGLVGAGLLFPQYAVYLPVTLLLFEWVYEQSHEIWKNKGLFPRKIRKYMGRITIGGAVYFGGIMLEWWCNPWVVDKIMDILNIL